MPPLKDNQIYAIDGGLFRAIYDEAAQRFQLWTYAGQSGRVIARTGFDIEADGTLYHRVFDFESREQVRIPVAEYTVNDLEAVAEEA
ncbi:MAG TPA: hypothetical protein P5121_16295 [Caldilineaceae bacterium]|nr:hypothetical protein [Caldilineaceae bacterium]